MTPDDAILAITAIAAPEKAVEMAGYHKATRRYLGASNTQIETLAKDWRGALSLDARLNLAEGLWRADIHETRIAAAKLLTQARIRPDDTGAWHLICEWMPQLDAWAIADAVCVAAQKRVIANLDRMNTVADWATSPLLWTRRAALVATLPLAKQNFQNPAEREARERALDWAAGLCSDHDWFIQKSIVTWIRDLSKHDAPRAATFLAEHGPYLKPFARYEAAQNTSDAP